MRFFISYRRTDTSAAALGQELYKRLSERGHRVFFDIESHVLGRDYEEKLNNAVEESDVMLVLIGPQWLPSFAERSNGTDHVKIEIARALGRRSFPVIPILVGQTPYPTANQLPPEIAGLAMRDGMNMHPQNLDQDLEKLLNELPRFSLLGDTTFGKQLAYCDLNYFNALGAPFRQEGWWRHIWWVWLMFLIPVFDLIAARGWRVDLARRVAYGSPNQFPLMKDIGHFFKSGFILWVMTGLYVMPLLLVFIGVDAARGFAIIKQIVDFVKAIMSGGDFNILWPIFWGIVSSVLRSFITVFIILVVGVLTTGPLYRVAVVRYALTGRKRVFFQFWTNFTLMLKNYRRVFVVYMVDNLNMYFLAIPIGIIFGPTTIIGFLVAFSIHYWVSGYLYGQLGRALILKTSQARGA